LSVGTGLAIEGFTRACFLVPSGRSEKNSGNGLGKLGGGGFSTRVGFCMRRPGSGEVEEKGDNCGGANISNLNPPHAGGQWGSWELRRGGVE